MHQSQFVSCRQAWEILRKKHGICRATAYNWVKAGRLRSVTSADGTRILVYKKDVLKLRGGEDENQEQGQAARRAA